MMQKNDVHRQFAAYFKEPVLAPYLYLLSKKFGDGHICLNLNTLDKADWEEAGFDKVADTNEIKKHALVSEGTGWKPFIVWENRLYLQRYFKYETLIFERIKRLIEDEADDHNEMKRALLFQKDEIKTRFSKGNTTQTDWQLVAAISAVLNHFTIITGGPGTGKTTTVSKVLSLLYSIHPNVKVALAAPTGKAAARMAQSLKNTADANQVGWSKEIKKLFENLTPTTIHRLLGWKRNSIYFRHDRDHPVRYDLIVIDESSMIDIALFAKLLDAVGSSTKLILLGDKDQLASVEAGSLFGDLCSASAILNQFGKERASFINQFMAPPEMNIQANNVQENRHLLAAHIIELKHSHRFSDQEGIGKLSKAVIQNKPSVLKEFFKNQDDRVAVEKNFSEDSFMEFVAGFEAYIREQDIGAALEKLNKLRILCAVREGPHGVYEWNRKVEIYLQRKGLIKMDEEFYENRPIMVTGNNYELNLFNGDIGIVRKDREGEPKVWFNGEDGNPKEVLPALIEAAETVFAMTIHKSQGSEFEKVMVVLPEMEDLPLLTRELLYTGVTRAKERVIMSGRESVILAAAEKKVSRASGIADRFLDGRL